MIILPDEPTEVMEQVIPDAEFTVIPEMPIPDMEDCDLGASDTRAEMEGTEAPERAELAPEQQQQLEDPPQQQVPPTAAPQAQPAAPTATPPTQPPIAPPTQQPPVARSAPPP